MSKILFKSPRGQWVNSLLPCQHQANTWTNQYSMLLVSLQTLGITSKLNCVEFVEDFYCKIQSKNLFLKWCPWIEVNDLYVAWILLHFLSRQSCCMLFMFVCKLHQIIMIKDWMNMKNRGIELEIYLQMSVALNEITGILKKTFSNASFSQTYNGSWFFLKVSRVGGVGDKSTCCRGSGISLSAFVTMCVTHQRRVAALRGDT